jgi:hypothetical protein
MKAMIRRISKAGRKSKPIPDEKVGGHWRANNASATLRGPFVGASQAFEQTNSAHHPVPWSACPYGEVHVTVRPTTLMIADCTHRGRGLRSNGPVQWNTGITPQPWIGRGPIVSSAG